MHDRVARFSLTSRPSALAAHGSSTKAENLEVAMKTRCAIAIIAIVCAARYPLAAGVEMPLPQHAAGVAFTRLASQDTVSALNGRWEGTTVSGHPLVLELQLQGQRLTGRLMVGKQSATITYGKVIRDAFAFTTGPIDGHDVDASGRQVGDAIELTIEGVKKPLLLTRVQ
jgi:hypothetical protein